MGANISKILIAVVCVVVGLGLYMLPIPIPYVKFGSVVIVEAGLSGILTCLFGNPTWKELAKNMCIGGCTAFISPGIKRMTEALKVGLPKLGYIWNLLENNITKSAIKTKLGHIIKNKFEKIFGGSINKDCKKLWMTFFGNLLSYGIADKFNEYYKKLADACSKLSEKSSLLLTNMNKSDCISYAKFLKKWRVGQKVLYPLAEFTKNFITALGVDYMDDKLRRREGNVNMKGALIIALSYSLICVAKTGITYRRDVHEKDQYIYNLAKQEELTIRNEDQKLDVKKHLLNPVEFGPGKIKLYEKKSSMAKDPNKSAIDLPTLFDWITKPTIFSTKDAIETFRYQSERYNYASVDEFGDGVGQTPTNTTSPEYVYARSNSNQPVTSSSSVTSINKDRHNNKKGKSRVTNDNFFFSQTNRS
ncbi:hypothetical protein C1645_757037, partial [Glomus cerebriforme]